MVNIFVNVSISHISTRTIYSIIQFWLTAFIKKKSGVDLLTRADFQITKNAYRTILYTVYRKNVYHTTINEKCMKHIFLSKVSNSEILSTGFSPYYI